MTRAKRWDVTKGILSVNGNPIVGFKTGDYFTASYDQDRHSKHMSPDGYGRLVKNPCKDGECMIGLSAQSPANTTLQALVKADEPLNISFVDMTRVESGFTSADCVIKKEPDMTASASNAEIDWVFIFTKGDIKHGGAVIVE